MQKISISKNNLELFIPYDFEFHIFERNKSEAKASFKLSIKTKLTKTDFLIFKSIVKDKDFNFSIYQEIKISGIALIDDISLKKYEDEFIEVNLISYGYGIEID